ncbi:hypothetical protein OIU84_006149 [Salix udensis]|uniref:DUF632 domain-containing protein n=1 Tax=Salix udensis TaxID=889485 RepID=A0AAD6JZQ5_9ROSI|nr:hypothetical protein OIU84_006149 [Salix udensis]
MNVVIVRFLKKKVAVKMEKGSAHIFMAVRMGKESAIKSSNKLARSITWNRSLSSRSSSSKSLLSSSSVSSSTRTELKSDLFDDYGMDAGSHSLTLGRLYAWEKKLYEEVKVNNKSLWSCSTLRSKLPVRYLSYTNTLSVDIYCICLLL